MSMNLIKLKWPINLQQTLLGGQSFRWTQSDEYFIGIFANIAWKIKADECDLSYEVLGELPYPTDANCLRIKVEKPKITSKKGLVLYEQKYYEQLLNKYFRLDSNLDEDYNIWIEAHKHFKSKTSKDQTFITQLDQEIVETLFSFICSQNNHISRISSLVEKLCTNYGELICSTDGRSFYNFPSLEKLSKDEEMESKLRNLGFGYRAKYIAKAAKDILNKGGVKWLDSLTRLNYPKAHDELIKLPGIGPKVGDCICLMALNFLEAVPVDTHIIQVAQHYIPEVTKVKSMNLKLYRKIGDTFRSVYGLKAGVAQTVLFCKELSIFNEGEPVEKKKKKK
ncbi:hypothetical protein ACKWTF_007457 [Chironomus riparius]